MTESVCAPGPWPSDYWRVDGPTYALPLYEAPDHLVPVSARDRMRGALHGEPNASDSCTLEGAHGLPPGVSPTAPVYHDAWTAWVRHPGHGACLPYLLDREGVLAVEQAAAGQPPPHPLSQLRRWQLVTPGVLTLPGRDDEERGCWERAAERAREEFEQRGIAPIPSVIEPFHLGRIRRYYRTLVRCSGRNGVHLGDKQTDGRYVAYNEPVARFFQHQLVEAVSQVVGHPVKPSFCFSACYVQGPGLPLHVDRLQCQFTLSVLVDMWPEPLTTSKWPLVLVPPSGRLAVYQALGDGVLFTGREIPHGRPAMRRKWFSTSLLFHYVDLDFDGPLG